MCFKTVHNDPSRSYKVVDFGTNQSTYMGLPIGPQVNSDLGPRLSCRVSERLDHLYAESHFFNTPPIFQPKFRGVTVGLRLHQ